MKRFSMILASVLVLPVCLPGAARVFAQDDGPKEIPAREVEAWQTAGAEPVWFCPSADRDWRIEIKRPMLAAADLVEMHNRAILPAFRWPHVEPGMIAKLAAPSQPFALDLSSSKNTDAILTRLSPQPQEFSA
jgi:hypothetical protein